MFIKIIRYSGLVLLGLILIFLLIINITPVPVSLFVREDFSKQTRTKPDNYDEYFEKVKVIKDLEYPSKYNDNYLDIYLPKTNEKIPVIIWIHGGAFVGGDKEDGTEFVTMLSASGYAVITANYERAPELKYPNQLHQVEEIYSFALDVAEAYNLDIDNIFLAGTSAGAHIISQFTLIQTTPTYASEMGFEKVIPNIKGLLLYSGPFNVEKINNVKNKMAAFLFSQTSWAYFGKRNWEELYGSVATIKNHITENFPPSFITDGNSRSFEEHAKELVSELEKNNVKVSSYFIPKDVTAGHEYQFKLDTYEGLNSLKETSKFLESIK